MNLSIAWRGSSSLRTALLPFGRGVGRGDPFFSFPMHIREVLNLVLVMYRLSPGSELLVGSRRLPIGKQGRGPDVKGVWPARQTVR